MNASTPSIPVTVLTGYLGSGKTTLLNRILSENHGKKYAVIVNEFGEIGIDNDLIIGADEEVFEMNNGCVCCTVRGDLVRILDGLMKRKGKFDAIIVETTGLADPAPVAQTFFVDQDVQDAASQFVELGHRFATGQLKLQAGGRVDFWLARPGGVDQWTYDVVGEETVHLPRLGAIQAFHLKPRPLNEPRGNISAEMWFAPSLQYLPVRIRIAQGADTYLDLLAETVEQK